MALYSLPVDAHPRHSSGFEQANQPILTDVQRRNLLHFAIVGALHSLCPVFFAYSLTSTDVSGGGPTGVEFAAELHDLLHTDIAKHYPNLARFAKISLYDVAPNILGSFDSGLAE